MRHTQSSSPQPIRRRSLVQLPDLSAQGYRVEQVLGRNLSGGRVTYLATQLSSDRSVVIKQFQFATIGANWTGYKAIQREIDILRSLDHPGIPKYLADIEMTNGFCLVQEYIPAESLASVRMLTVAQVQQIGRSLLGILVYLQDGDEGKGRRVEPIVHRDIKPDNILLALAGSHQTAYLVDFGLARIGGRFLSESTEMGGTFGFMPPEQFLKRELTKASDLYGLGMTLVCLLTGTRAAHITDLIDISTFKVNFKPRLSLQINPDWIEWLESMVHPNPGERFPDAHSALSQLPMLLSSSASLPDQDRCPNQTKQLPEAHSLDLHRFPFEFAQIRVQPKPGFRLLGGKEIVTSSYDWETQGYVEDLGDGIGMQLILIPAGEFWMGSPDHELARSPSEGPRRQIGVAAVFLGRFPVTQVQWQQVATWPHVEQDLPNDPSRFKHSDRPVETISWQEAVEFCGRLSNQTGRRYRLPTEAEWEYACRSGTTTPFHLGNTITSGLVNYNARQPYGSGPRGVYRRETLVVGELGLANGFGLADMHGNVWEWCSGLWQETYASEPVDELRVVRGGSWNSGPGQCRSACRRPVAEFWRSDQIGLRVCCDLDLGGLRG